MSRRHKADKKIISPDCRYKDLVISKFINNLMWDGKKSVAETLFYKALETAAERLGQENPADVLHGALANVKPSVEVKPRRVGGATYQVPSPVHPSRAQILAIRWIISSARSRPEKTMVEKLSVELKNAFEETGAAVKKRIDTSRMAEANRAFSHFRF